jgi:tripartite-type tricarboxylate transporter receptor subunit TctC
MNMTRKKLSAVAVGVVVGGMLGAAPASADVAGFYQGKVVKVMVPSGLGATLGLYGHLVVEHLGKHIPGNPTVVIESRPGGGGTRGAAFAYSAAPKDGTYIAEVLAPSVITPLLRDVKFDASKFQWLGSVTPRPAVVSMWHTSPVKTLDEAKKKQAIMGSTGLGSETYLVPTLMNEVLGTKFKIVKGYKGGGALNKALESGEIQGRMQYWSGWTAGKPQWLKEKKLIHLVKYGGEIRDLPNVPSLAGLMKTPEHKAMVSFIETAPKIGMGFWVSPDVPKDRLEALRKAFIAMLDDPEFKADAKKRRAPVDAVSGETLQKLVASAYATPKSTVTKLKNVLGFK